MNLSDLKEGGASGTVRLAEWQMDNNGDEYIYFWCKDWRIITDKDMPLEGFRSSEKWQLIATDGARGVLALFQNPIAQATAS